MRRIAILASCTALAIGLWQSYAVAAIGASATYTSQQLSANSYQYSITLHNTGSTSIGTFWFGWIPGYDFLPNTATSVSSPPGWAGVSIHDATGGYAIEWYELNTTSALPSGQPLSGFTITTPDAPATIAGPSFLGPAYPVSTSWVYVGQLQDGANPSDQGSAVSATAVPEPVVVLLAPVGLLLLRSRR